MARWLCKQSSLLPDTNCFQPESNSTAIQWDTCRSRVKRMKAIYWSFNTRSSILRPRYFPLPKYYFACGNWILQAWWQTAWRYQHCTTDMLLQIQLCKYSCVEWEWNSFLKTGSRYRWIIQPLAGLIILFSYLRLKAIKPSSQCFFLWKNSKQNIIAIEIDQRWKRLNAIYQSFIT